MSKQEITAAEAENPSEATSDVSEIIDDASEALQLDLDERDSSPVNWETDTSETRQIGASGSEIVNEDKNGKGSAFVDDSSSTCSTDSASAPFKVQVSPNRYCTSAICPWSFCSFLSLCTVQNNRCRDFVCTTWNFFLFHNLPFVLSSFLKKALSSVFIL